MSPWKCSWCNRDTVLPSHKFPDLCCWCVVNLYPPAVSMERQLEEEAPIPSILDSDYIHFRPEDFRS